MGLAFSYLRMSRIDQLSGDSLDRQLGATRAYAAAHGLFLDEKTDMRDIGIPAFKGQNRIEGALAGFLELIKHNKVPSGSFFLVESFDRISREEVSEATDLLFRILKAGVTVVTLSDKQTYSIESINKNPYSLMQALMVFARAHEESQIKSERVLSAWSKNRDNARKGERKLTTKGPAWLQFNGNEKTKEGDFELIEDRALVIERIFRLCADGIGAYVIAKQLSAEVKPWGRSIGWQSSYIKKILHNEACIGLFQPHRLCDGSRIPEGEPIKNYFPQAVDENLFWRARAALEIRRTGHSGKKGETLPNLFSGIARCGRCGGPMHYINKGKTKKGGTYLQCDYTRRNAGCDLSRTFDYELTEIAVLSTMPEADLGVILDAESAELIDLQRRRDMIGGRLGATFKAQNELVDLFQGRGFGSVKSAVGKRIAQLGREYEELERERDQVEEKLRAASSISARDSADLVDRGEKYLAAINAIQEPAERYQARSALVQRLRGLVERIEFCEQVILVEFRGGNLGMRFLDDDATVMYSAEQYAAGIGIFPASPGAGKSPSVLPQSDRRFDGLSPETTSRLLAMLDDRGTRRRAL